MKVWVLALLICFELVISKVQGTSKDKCELEPPSRGILDLKQELKPAKLLNVTTLNHLKDCGELCCNLTRCNAYIWRNSEQCFLFNCRILTDCKVVPYQGTITGFVKKDERSAEVANNGKQETPHSELTGDISNRTPLKASKKSNDNEAQNSTDSNTTLNTVRIQSLTIKKKPKSGKAAIADKKTTSESSDNEKRTMKGHNTTNSKVTTSSHSATKTSKTLKKRGKMSKSNNTKQTIPVLNSSNAQKVTHTTTVSLIAALTFGVVFLVAVLILIGRPWWDSLAFNKDGYNRITFLMNGK